MSRADTTQCYSNDQPNKIPWMLTGSCLQIVKDIRVSQTEGLPTGFQFPRQRNGSVFAKSRLIANIDGRLEGHIRQQIRFGDDGEEICHFTIRALELLGHLSPGGCQAPHRQPPESPN